VPIERNPCVYMLASQPRGTLYIGVTSNLEARLWQHREDALPGFTQQHGVKRLVWFEMHGDMVAAITREKQLKNWRRQWKINLIEQTNPRWDDLAVGLGFPPLRRNSRRDGP
jgi:putative endonuclease